MEETMVVVMEGEIMAAGMVVDMGEDMTNMTGINY
jgi:hypothetical protein